MQRSFNIDEHLTEQHWQPVFLFSKPSISIDVCCSYIELSRSKLHKTGDLQVGNWHVNCQHSSLYSCAAIQGCFWRINLELHINPKASAVLGSEPPAGVKGQSPRCEPEVLSAWCVSKGRKFVPQLLKVQESSTRESAKTDTLTRDLWPPNECISRPQRGTFVCQGWWSCL